MIYVLIFVKTNRLITQRDAQTTIRIAQEGAQIARLSREDNQLMVQIAKATMRDSSSLKTVAVLTMIFLPATFVCVSVFPLEVISSFSLPR